MRPRRCARTHAPLAAVRWCVVARWPEGVVRRHGPRVTCFAPYWLSAVQLAQPASHPALAGSQLHSPSNPQSKNPLSSHDAPSSLRARRRAGSAQGCRGKVVATWSKGGRTHQSEASCRRALIAAPIVASFGRSRLGSVQPLAAESRARWTSKPRACPGPGRRVQNPNGAWACRRDSAVRSPSSGA